MRKIFLCFFLLLPTISKADNFYLGGSVGLSNHNIWNYENFVSKDESDKAFKLLVGYQIDSNLSAEFGYADLGKGRFNHSDGSTGTLNLNAFLVNIRINLLNNQKIIPYVKLGVSRLRNAERWSDSTSFDNKTETNLYWALGGEYAFDKNYFLTFDYDYYGKSGAFNRNDWSTQPAGVKSSSMTIGIKYTY